MFIAELEGLKKLDVIRNQICISHHFQGQNRNIGAQFCTQFYPQHKIDDNAKTNVTFSYTICLRNSCRQGGQKSLF